MPRTLEDPKTGKTSETHESKIERITNNDDINRIYTKVVEKLEGGEELKIENIGNMLLEHVKAGNSLDVGILLNKLCEKGVDGDNMATNIANKILDKDKKSYNTIIVQFIESGIDKKFTSNLDLFNFIQGIQSGSKKNISDK